MVVEDEETIRDVVRMALEEIVGAQVVEAADGDLAIERLGEIRPDVVLLDLRLPTIDGFAVLRRLKADPSTAAIPVIVLTTSAIPTDRARAAELGADAYIDKPFDLDQLVALVEGYLAR